MTVTRLGAFQNEAWNSNSWKDRLFVQTDKSSKRATFGSTRNQEIQADGIRTLHEQVPYLLEYKGPRRLLNFSRFKCGTFSRAALLPVNTVFAQVTGKWKREVGLVVPAKFTAFTTELRFARILERTQWASGEI